MATRTEEDYIKAIFKITEKNQGSANTNAIAKHLSTSAASVTDMLKRLSEKEYFHYEKYKGVYLTSKGIDMAIKLIRKHRLWEVFLVNKLNFSWDEVHDIAEQLEHIQSEALIEKLDHYLGHPKYDPHGDPIPNAEGKFTLRSQDSLFNLCIGEKGSVVGVREHDNAFLKYLNKLEINLGTRIEVKEHIEFDHSMHVIIDDQNEAILSNKVSKNIFVKKSQLL
ncbi:MAG: metal-dependent transcriptional regulator [Saprospiraceae bacterium]|nr:metal-dependent transcriptional regulator [Saprospiraceae bacterium]NNK89196.1 metal-dependent transcriptional regulator [Saprospiraceae bacterium]